MVTTQDFINVKLTKDEVLSCLKKAKENTFLDNLRYRHPNVQFDCKVRGYVGELAIKKWFESNSIEIEATDYLADGDSIDIDFKVKGLNLEIKTSLIPDVDGTLENVLAKRDIKLICRNGQSIEQLRGDIHVQIFFQQKTKQKDAWLKQQVVDIKHDSLETLYNSFRADAYTNTTFIVAWIDKETLVSRINAMPISQQQWSFPGSSRYFWKCSLKSAKKPIELITLLKNRLSAQRVQPTQTVSERSTTVTPARPVTPPRPVTPRPVTPARPVAPARPVTPPRPTTPRPVTPARPVTSKPEPIIPKQTSNNSGYKPTSNNSDSAFGCGVMAFFGFFFGILGGAGSGSWGGAIVGAVIGIVISLYFVNKNKS